MTTKPLASLVDNEAELSVLGGVLIRPDLLPLLPDLDVDCFANPHHGHVFGAMRNLEAKGVAIDVTTVADQLERDGHLNTPPSLLGECALRCPTPENVEHYAAILKRHRIGRQVHSVATSTLGELVGGHLQGPDALVELQAALARLDLGERDDRGKAIGTIAGEIAADLARGAPAAAGIRTTLRKLDAKTGGIPFGVPTLVLAPPGTGKSTLALRLCEGAEAQGDTPLLYSYEDGHRSFGQRALARHSGVPTEVIRAGEFTRGQLEALGEHMPEVLRRRTVVIRAAGMAVEDLVRDVRARRLRHRGEGTVGQLVVIDYVQRMPPPRSNVSRDANRNLVLGETSRRLADLAATEGIAVVICSQVGRQAPREARPPILQDARDCGELEADAKLALGLYRPAAYDKPPTGEDGDPAPPPLLELHILKNHQGAADCHVELYWDLETHAIVDAPVDLAGRRGR